MSIDRLTREEAAERVARIADVDYVLDLSLEAGSKTYEGDCTIRFAATGSGDTFLDFHGLSIEALEINGVKTDAPTEDYRIPLPGATLADENEVRVRYVNQYDHSGEGFHQFVDPADGSEYLYSQFEPFSAHRMFPCFDQPDIKSTYELTVTAPAEWEVTSAAREVGSEETADGRIRRAFERTVPFSTYLLSVAAGPYKAVADSHNGMPLRLLARASMQPFLDAEENFATTKAGVDFFGSFFDQPYPFGKLDQVFVPEFNWGAMENVGNIVHSDNLLFRDPPTANQRRRRAEVVLHEIAHMWFGNLVTMRWWDDLWLNESFATFMAYTALDQATDYEHAWLDFSADIKRWAYYQDQLPSTHRIADQVPSTEETFLNFDGITYGKGAASLKQLVASVGEEAFREGMRTYFRRFAFRNATLHDFLTAVGEGAGVDVASWSKQWLETPSLNTLHAEIETAGDTVTGLTLHQAAPPDYPTLRAHYVEVGLVDDDLGVAALPVRIEAESVAVSDAVGMDKPVLVFPNYNDHTFAKIKLDDRSLIVARGRLGDIPDPLLRLQLYESLWEMVRDAEMSSIDYVAMVAAHAPAETEVDIIRAATANAAGAIGRYVPEDQKMAQAHDFVNAARAALDQAPAGDARVIWARALLPLTMTTEDLELAARIVESPEGIEGLAIDQDMRWTVALRWAAHGMPGAEERLAEEHERDQTDRGRRRMITAETSWPNIETKQSAWERIHGDGWGSLHDDLAAMAGFNWWSQRELLAPYVEPFFTGLPGEFEEKEHEVAIRYFNAMFPSYRVDHETRDRAQALLDAIDGPATLHRQLVEAIADLDRALRCRAFAARG